MKQARFISRYGKLAGNSPTTAAATQMRPSTAGGLDGSTQNAEFQIRQSPQPFQNPMNNMVSGVGSNQAFKRMQVQGSPAPGVRPRINTAAAPRSDPPNHAQMMQWSGYPPDYAPKQGYSPVISGRLQPGLTRIWRGAVPGSKKLVDDSDLFSPEGIRNWNKNARGL
jgi:hypothetical protein